ncbi:hypothetical protein NLX83_24300 [Allokutzneria sp. A3M-2-11 16]|uniref:hypothetical protein n=1 Tax=Allokutzneria sp. A3M-2-11 16 TaxID=2962043 RepID=UPI0020B6AB68|nr:hypothetical protein [Allokutzneria sp. A3M-2-11 16]MCP3802394.1 hypothetical protein [Allokutzneria sp. A3M-2-11 16]
MSVERVSQQPSRPSPAVLAPRRRRVHLGPAGRGPRPVSAIPVRRPAVRKRNACFLAPLVRRTRRWSPAMRQAVFTMVPLITFGAVSMLAGPAVAAIILASLFGGAALCRWHG